MGCVASEDDLPKSREYGGGPMGSNIMLAAEHAVEKGHKYIALAGNGIDGHSFSFKSKPKLEKAKSSVETTECAHTCSDDDKFYCGCTDGACGSLSPHGQHLRRWIVYKVVKQ